jgi:hypothetical protein
MPGGSFMYEAEELTLIRIAVDKQRNKKIRATLHAPRIFISTTLNQSSALVEVTCLTHTGHFTSAKDSLRCDRTLT